MANAANIWRATAGLSLQERPANAAVNASTPWTYDWLNANWTYVHKVLCVKDGKCEPVNLTANGPIANLNYPPQTPLTNGWEVARHTLDMTANLSMGGDWQAKTTISAGGETGTAIYIFNVSQ